MQTPIDLNGTYFDAVRRNDLEEVRRLLLETPVLVKARWRGRGRPDGKMRSLGPAPYNQHTWIDAPVNSLDPDDPRFTSTPLIWARDDAMVRLLVELGADVNAKGTSGEIELPEWFFTPLWRAAHDGRIESVRLLVEHGADLNRLNPDGCNQALKTAAENGASEVCAYLLEHGAQPDIHSACMLGLVEEVERWIAADRLHVERRDEHGRSPLDAALLMDSFRAPLLQTTAHDRIAALLEANGATVELAHAASAGWIDRVRRMVEQHPDLATAKRTIEPLLTGSAEFESPLEAVCRRGRAEIEHYLLDHSN